MEMQAYGPYNPYSETRILDFDKLGHEIKAGRC